MSDTPEPSRNDGKSSLDFAHWAMVSVEDSYPRSVPLGMPEPSLDATGADYSFVKDCLERTGIALPDLADDGQNLGLVVYRHFQTIPLDKALRTRGAIVYRQGRMAICMGFRFVVYSVDTTFIYRYISYEEELQWDFGLQVKGMTYQ